MAVFKYLSFFDKEGNNFNFDYDSDLDTWTGKIYFTRVATDLHANEHIFILERVLTGSPADTVEYTYPVLDTQVSPVEAVWRTRWADNKAKNEIFTYQVVEENNIPYIAKYEEIDWDNSPQSYTVNSDGQKEMLAVNSSALKINIGFVAKDENIYERSLIIEDLSGSAPRMVATIYFYGESIGEDERFRLMLQNIGRQLDHNDALMMREYDIKEGLPDWELINEKRKEMLIAGEEIFPYMGSYRGLVNIIRLFGYNRDLRIKEYWLNVDQKSEYYGKIKQIQINGLLTDENSPFVKHPLIPTTTHRKKGEFGLFYDITVETGDVDTYGIPITESSSQFTPEEVLIKLFAFKEKLQRDYMPVNARIVDIVGEGIYFERYGIRTWTDPLRIFPVNIALNVDFVSDPNVGYIRDLRRFRVMQLSPGLDLPVDRFTNVVNPYTMGQAYPPYAVPILIEAINDFYTELSTFDFPYGDERENYYGDEPILTDPNAYYALNATPPEVLSAGLAGCPVILSAVLDTFSWDDLSEQSWDDIQQFTWDNLDYSNFYEIQWTIEKGGDLPYFFSFRGPVTQYNRLPHFLPYEGSYKVTMEIFDLFNARSIEIKESYIKVENHELEIIAFGHWRNFAEYTWDGTTDTWDDLGSSTWHFPIEGITTNESPLPEQLLNWARYTNQNLAQILNKDTNTYEYLDASTDTSRVRFGTVNLTWDNMDLPWDEMYHSTWHMYDYHGEKLGGFKIFSVQIGDGIQVDDWPIFYFEDESPSIAPLDFQEAVDQLNNSTNPGIALFDYHVYQGPTTPPYIQATGKWPGASSWHFITYYGMSPASGELYTWKYPTWLQYQQQLQDILTTYPTINEDHLFLDVAPLSDIISDEVGSLTYWQDAGFMKTEDPTTDFPLGERRGYIPSHAGTAPFNAGDLRVFKNEFAAPLGVPLFFIHGHSEAPGKTNARWRVTNTLTGEVVMDVINTFLIINFIEESSYDIECWLNDANGNQLYTKRPALVTTYSKANMPV